MTETTPIRPLAADFDEPAPETWMRLVEKALKGGDFEKRMVARTADNIRIEPLYTRRDALTEAEAAVPGTAPYVRGTAATATGLGWNIEQVVVAGDPAAANAYALAELEGGANGIVLRIAAPGQTGTPIASAADMARVLEGVYLDFAPVTLDAGLAGQAAARHLAEAARASKAAAGKLHLRFDLDPIGTLARTGHAAASAAASVTEAISLAAELRAEFAAARTLLADGRIVHEAGGSEAQELAFIATSLIAYLRAFEAQGTGVAEALAQMTVALAADADLFVTVAKLRACRRIVGRIAETAGERGAARHVRMAVTSSQRMMTKRDPWTNMLRTTAATLGAAFGGADAVTVLPYTWALGWPDAFARRIARNTQIVAQEESSLGRVVDPAGGSWYVEKLTSDLAAAAWERVRRIEGDGGLLAALGGGGLQREVAATAAQRDKAIATGKQPLTGTSAFPLIGSDGVTVTPWPAVQPLSGEGRVQPFTQHRLAAPFEDLRDAADHAAQRDGKPLTVFLASLGSIADHTARTTWVKNQLAVAGIASLASDGYASPAEAAAAFKQSGTSAACICSSDALYAEMGGKTARALVEAGADLVAMAGRPGDGEASLRAAGVTKFLYAGQNAIETLTELQHQLTG